MYNMNIKDYREKELKSYIIGTILIVLCLEDMISLSKTGTTEISAVLLSIVNSGVFGSIIYVMSKVTDCTLTSQAKKILVYMWGRMPGETVFTDIKVNNKDNRFTTAEVLEKYDYVYNNIESDTLSSNKEKRMLQNSYWNDAYSRVEKNPKILISQRDFLMCRDMVCITVIIAILYMVLSIGFKIITFKTTVLIYLLVSYSVCDVAARVKAKRFVFNVIASDIRTS